jgi:hypothetical protein
MMGIVGPLIDFQHIFHRRYALFAWGGIIHCSWVRGLRTFFLELAGRPCQPARPDDREQAAWAYGGNPARLRVLERRSDPDGVFSSAIPLPEGSTGPVTFETHSP